MDKVQFLALIIIIRDSQKMRTTLSATPFLCLPLARAEAIGLSTDPKQSEC